MKLVFRGIFPVFNYMTKRDDHIVSLAKRGDLYYMILDLRTHPTAYVGVGPGHKHYGKDYEKIDLDVHGGLTFCGNHKTFNYKELEYKKVWWYGWDYAHAGDFLGHGYPLQKSTDKKWTYLEVFRHVLDALEELKKL